VCLSPSLSVQVAYIDEYTHAHHASHIFHTTRTHFAHTHTSGSCGWYVHGSSRRRSTNVSGYMRSPCTRKGSAMTKSMVSLAPVLPAYPCVCVYVCEYIYIYMFTCVCAFIERKKISHSLLHHYTTPIIPLHHSYHTTSLHHTTPRHITSHCTTHQEGDSHWRWPESEHAQIVD
jgi:hypothetical protein